MATIKYNNLTNPTNLVTFSDVPNILSVTDASSGTCANMRIIVSNPIARPTWKSVTTANTQWYITFLGETITNVLDPKDAINKNFYVADTPESTAESICKAFRNCPTINSQFNIFIDRQQSGYGHIVYFKARTEGPMWDNMPLTNNCYYIDSAETRTNYVSYAGTNGTSTNPLYGCKVDVDVYNTDGYLTTLEKNFYGDNCSFDLTPVLSTISNVGETNKYDLYVTATDNSGNTSTLSSVTNNYTSVGYMVNQGEMYLSASTGIEIAQNVLRGSTKSSYNNTILYVTNEQFPISIYTLTSGTISYTVSYKDSAFNEISSTQLSQTLASGKVLYTLGVPISIPSDCFYVDVTVGGKTIRYNVIKPANASYGKQRIYWTNSYGGTSFFDFTGEKVITNDAETQTYNKNLLDYYDQSILTKEKVYDKQIKTTYNIKTHLLEKDGTWSLYDLLQSPNVWTTINGQSYTIIIEKVQVSEINNQDIYEGTVAFRISQPVSL